MARFLNVVIAISFSLILTAPRASEAATFVVSSNADAGSGSLRAAIALANADAAADLVTINSGIGTITLTTGEIVVLHPVTVSAAAGGQVISGSGSSRIFRTVAGASLSLVGLTLQDGKTTASSNPATFDCATDGGGGAICAMGSLSLSRCSVLGSTVTGSNSGGGGVFVFSDLTMKDSLISGNSAGDLTSRGGGVAVVGTASVDNAIVENNRAGIGGGMFVSGVSKLTDCTIAANQARDFQGGGLVLFGNSTLQQTTVSGNSAADEGGGIWLRATSLVISNSTITENRASSGGGGIHVLSADPPSVSVTLSSTILANNQGSLGSFGRQVVNLGGAITLNATASEFGDAAAEIDGTNTANVFDDAPGLGALGDYGCALAAGAGATASCVPVHPLKSSSPARDKGANSLALVSDQRGTGFDRTVGAGTDIGAVEAQGSLLIIDPTAWSFGFVPVGSSASRDVTLSNGGTETLNISAITSPGAPFALTGGTCASPPFALSAGASCTVQSTFSPTAAGTQSTALVQVTSDSTGPSVRTLTLSGDTLEAKLVLSPDPLDFGAVAVGGTSGPVFLTVSNPGSKLLQVSSVSGLAPPFLNAFTGTCPFPISVAAGGSCTVAYELRPTAAGSFSQDLTFTSNAIAASDDVVTLRGSGVAPQFASPDLVDFGSVLVGSSSVTMDVTLSNPLVQQALNFTAITAPTAPFSSPVGGTCPSVLPFQLLPGGSCTLTYQLSPTAVGGASQVLTATFDVIGGGGTPLTAGGLSAAVGGTTEDVTVGRPVEAATGPQTATWTLQGIGVTPLLTLSPDPLDFGDVVVDTESALMDVTVSNPGGAPLSVTAITAPSAPFASLAGGSCGAVPFTVAAAGSCTLSYRFSPTATGSASQVLTFASDASGTPDNLVTLTGVGVAPRLVLSDSVLDFGAVATTPSSPLLITIENVGSAPAALGSLALGGVDPAAFALSSDSCSGQVLDVGATCRVAVGFTGSAPGTRVAEMLIPSNASSFPDTVSLRAVLEAVVVPTLGFWSLGLLGILLAGIGVMRSGAPR